MNNFHLKNVRKTFFFCLIAFLPSVEILVQAQEGFAISNEAQLAKAYQRNPRVVDFYSPVVTFERFQYRSGVGPSYKIKIFSDGRVIYQGFRNVKILGDVDFKISKSQVLEIIEEFSRTEFFQLDSEGYATEIPGVGALLVEFSIRQGDKLKSVRMDWQPLGAVLVLAIEQHVQSEKWRCPFVIQPSGEKSCTLWEESLRQGAAAYWKTRNQNGVEK